MSLAPSVIDCLCGYYFAGNVRELANLIERLVVLTPGEQINLADLPAAVRKNEDDSCQIAEEEWNLSHVLQGVERRMIMRALKTGGSQRKAAKLLQIDHSTLSRKIKRHGLSRGAIRHHDALLHHPKF
jgi:transcriptional regulator with PAS, ATPase and Fis domain